MLFRRLSLSLLLLSFSITSGCATFDQMSESLLEWSGYYVMDLEQCETANWRNVGYQDGQHDKDRSRFYKYQESCERFMIHPDQVAYDEGFDFGYQAFLQDYCTYENGYEIGRDGDDYRKICPANLRDKFLNGYQHGYDLYIVDYCTPENGLKRGKNGWGYDDICPSELRYTFVKYYKRGKKIRKLTREIDDLDVLIGEKSEYLRYNGEFIEDDERWYLKNELSNLESDRRRLRDTLALLDVVELIDDY